MPSMTREEAFVLFKAAAQHIWTNADFVLPWTSLSMEEPSGTVLASVTGDGKQRAFDNTITRRSFTYVVKFSNRLLAMPLEHIHKVLIHEVLHLGYHGHGEDFRRLTRQHGGAVSEHSIEDPGIKVERKVGARYAVIPEAPSFTDEREAIRWAREEQRRAPGKYRVMFGGVDSPVPLATPTKSKIVAVLQAHPLIKLRERVKRAFVVGSFAKGLARPRGHAYGESDVDILLEVAPRAGYTPEQLEEKYRQPLRQYFVKHNIRGKADEVHPQWDGRRVDVYFTYDANAEARPKIELAP